MLWTAELLYHRGINFYSENQKRLTTIIHADTLSKGEGKPFRDLYFWKFVREHRLKQ